MKRVAKFNLILMGALGGTLLILLLLAWHSSIVSNYGKVEVPKWTYDSNFISSKGGKDLQNVVENVNSLKAELINLDEKVSSTNKRLDDLLLYGTVVVTLLLALLVGAYFRADAEVSKYFRENFDIHVKQMNNYVNEAGTELAKIKVFVSYIQKNFKVNEQNQSVPAEEIKEQHIK